jgi:hypothetical protein
MSLAEEVRRLRGERSRNEFALDLFEQTGVRVSAQQVIGIEAFGRVPRLPDIACALLIAYPELVEYIIPRKVLEAVCFFAQE